MTHETRALLDLYCDTPATNVMVFASWAEAAAYQRGITLPWTRVTTAMLKGFQ